MNAEAESDEIMRAEVEEIISTPAERLALLDAFKAERDDRKLAVFGWDIRMAPTCEHARTAWSCHEC